MSKEKKKMFKELESYIGRGSVGSKAEFFHNTAIELLMKFETRSYGDIEVFCSVLKSYAKTTEICFRGVEQAINHISDDEFYREAILNR